jgi:putative ABC transport system ATP-binding protein
MVSLSIKGVSKKYSDGTEIILHDTVFTKEKSYCILGPSGCGKSTLLNMLAGLIKPTEGSVLYGNRDISYLTQSQMDEFRYDNIGYISQDFRLFEDFTVKDNLKIVSTGGLVTNTPQEVLEKVNLEGKLHKKIKSLSGGERQRVSIARALLQSPLVMLCDEPTASLNYKLATDIIELLIDTHNKDKNTLIVVTHDERMSKYFDETIRFEKLLKEGVTQNV